MDHFSSKYVIHSLVILGSYRRLFILVLFALSRERRIDIFVLVHHLTQDLFHEVSLRRARSADGVRTRSALPPVEQRTRWGRRGCENLGYGLVRRFELNLLQKVNFMSGLINTWPESGLPELRLDSFWRHISFLFPPLASLCSVLAAQASVYLASPAFYSFSSVRSEISASRKSAPLK